MNDLTKRMRHRRFQVKSTAEIQFLIETPTGAKYQLRLQNVSLNGIAGWTDEEIPSDEGMDVGAVFPAAKVTFDGHEHALGRLVLRVANKRDGRLWLAFSAIDMRMPVDGPISKYIDQELGEPQSAFDFELSPDKFSMASFAEGLNSNVDLFAKVHHFNVFMKDWKKTSKFSYMNIRKPSMGQRIRLNRPRKNGREDYVIMGSNDYLGLASHPEVREAAKNAIDQYGFGATGSAVSTGMSEAHVELSDYLAKLLGKEKVVLFNSGYTANIGIITGLIHQQDLTVADMISHASIQDAMQMSRGASRFFKHSNVAHLDKVLTENREQYSGCLVVTEGAFSMDGDVPQLDKILETAKKHRARLMIDEAHSFGVIGPTGLGTCEKYGVMEQTDLIMGTFSKICGGIGGFVATSEEVANWIYFWARSHLFSVAIPPSTAAAALKALQIFREDRSLFTTLRSNIDHFKRGLAGLGCHLPPEHDSAVIPVVVGDEKKLEVMNKVLMEAGVFVVPVVYPVVSRSNARFRFTIMANHTISDLDFVLNVLELAMQKADFKFEQLAEKRVA